MPGTKVADRDEFLVGKIWFKPGCWEWTGYINPYGYGEVRVGPRMEKAHRVAYEFWVGPIPEGLDLDHLCRNRGCVNPSHLEPVTRRVNVLRGEGITARRARSDRCVQGHEYTPENTLNREGFRRCRACRNAQNHKQYLRRRAAQAAA